MGAVSLLEDYEDSKKLPLGHYGRKEAKEAVDREYELCRQVEARWMKRLRKRLSNRFPIAQTEVWAPLWAEKLCRSIGSKPPKQVLFNCPAYAGGMYLPVKKTVLLKPYASISTLVHELAHHICHIEGFFRANHGEKFIWAEEVLFETLETILKEEDRALETW